MFELIKQQNIMVPLFEITSSKFESFGKILPLSQIEDAVMYLQNTTIPDSGNQYIAHDEQFVKALKNTSLFDTIFGHVPLQYGYVNGHNRKLNALEYHKSSEINIALDDMVLFVGHAYNIDNESYDISNCVALYIPKHTVFELYPEVLHFSPCALTQSGFRCGVILPLGTNMDLPHGTQSGMLFKTNKWLLAHPEAEHLLQRGAVPGLQGPNVEIQLIEDEK